jgi:hypothetical protein
MEDLFMKKIAIVFALLVTIIIGFSPAEPQGEELLYFLPEVQLARSLKLSFDSETRDRALEQLEQDASEAAVQLLIDEITKISVDSNLIFTHFEDAGVTSRSLRQFIQINNIDFENYVRFIAFITAFGQPLTIEALNPQDGMTILGPFNLEKFELLTRFLIDQHGISLVQISQIINDSVSKDEVFAVIEAFIPKPVSGGFISPLCPNISDIVSAKISSQPEQVWINEHGQIRSQSEAMHLLVDAQELVEVFQDCLPFFPSSIPDLSKLEDVISGQSASIDGIVVDGTKESVRVSFSRYMAFDFIQKLDVEITAPLLEYRTAISNGNSEEDALSTLESRLIELPSCVKMKQFVTSGETIEVQYGAFLSLTIMPFTLRSSYFPGQIIPARLIPCFSRQLVAELDSGITSQESLVQRVRNNDIEAAIILNELFLEKLSNARQDSEHLTGLRQELIELVLSHTAEAAPLVTLALISSLATVGLG